MLIKLHSPSKAFYDRLLPWSEPKSGGRLRVCFASYRVLVRHRFNKRLHFLLTQGALVVLTEGCNEGPHMPRMRTTNPTSKDGGQSAELQLLSK